MAVPRSYHATDGARAATVARRRKALPNGVWGMLLFIATEAALFGCLIASYFYLRFMSVRWPPAGIEPPKVALPLILTGALVATMLPVLAAVRAADRGRAGTAQAWLCLAVLVQGGYLAVQIVEYLHDLDTFSIGGSAYGSVYFTLLGAHHAHVAIGLLLNLWLIARLAGGLTTYRLTAVRVVAWYWAFVVVLAVFVVATQVSAA